MQFVDNIGPDQHVDPGSLIWTFPVQSLFICVEVLWSSQPIGVMSSAVILPNHTFTGQA